jgi:two-component system cell cycle sensor histidine kinase/response regulator CckA
MMAIELIRPLAATESDQETINLLSDSARRGAEVVRQLLIFGRGSDAPREVMDVLVVVREILRIVRETFPRNIKVVERIPERLPPSCAHPTQLYQALLNLCVNARDAMAAGGQLSLAAFPTELDEAFVRMNPGAQVGQYLVLSVTDTGTGIEPAIQEKIFDPFFSTKEHGKGTGLGLSTVIGIARSHGGFVAVSSQVGVGSEFRLFLPVAVEAIQPVPGQPQLPVAIEAGAGELILLVDDEAGIRLVLERVLAARGYRVITAESGTEAVEQTRRHQADLRAIVLDMMMPGIDGIAVIKAIREFAPLLPIVGCSGLHTYAAQIEKLDSPGVRFLRKPFPVAELLHALRQLMQA